MRPTAEREEHSQSEGDCVDVALPRHATKESDNQAADAVGVS